MVELSERLLEMKKLVDDGKYFCIIRPRQYGKTTTLSALRKHLTGQYEVVSLSFQKIGQAGFESEGEFVQSLTRLLLASSEFAGVDIPQQQMDAFRILCRRKSAEVKMDELFRIFRRWCKNTEKTIVLLIDEVDTAANNQVFLDFLAQLRGGYLKRKKIPTFQSVILAGVTDIKHLKSKIRPEDTAKFNSPWNIAADFTIDMSLSASGIKGMLDEYEADHHTGMDTATIAQEIYNYTEGYPYLVSRICQKIDEMPVNSMFATKAKAWTIAGVSEAVRQILFEKNTLFDSLMGKVYVNPNLSAVLQRILFGGERILYNPDNIPAMDGEMYGFISNRGGALGIANRIFETRLYNYFLSLTEMKSNPISKAGASEREEFIQNGHLDMEKLLTHYVTVFDDVYEGKAEPFDEEEGRRRFLLFIRPVINGTGNYYIETRTRDDKRMDLVIDYLGRRHVVELKIWRGQAYHEKGERQLAGYLDSYHLDTGYMLTYSFNKGKKRSVDYRIIDGKKLMEATV